MSEAIFNFTAAKSGRIRSSGGYTASTGWDQCAIYRQVSGRTLEDRAYFSFDTSSLPDDAIIDEVWFYQKLRDSQPVGTPEFLAIRYYLGTFIGTALDGNQAEWDGGTSVLLDGEEYDGIWIQLTGAGQSQVNLTGDTDLKIRDESVRGTGDASWGTSFNADKDMCKLKVVYHQVHQASASATGKGLLGSVLGGFTRAGAATALGVGLLGIMAAAVDHSASASSTGIGSASGTAAMEASAGAAATGSGYVGATAALLLEGIGTATGSGSVAAAGTVEEAIWEASATATGSGSVSALASLLLDGIGTATASGTVDAAGAVEEAIWEASATATGSGLLGVVFPSIDRSGQSSLTGSGLVQADGTVLEGGEVIPGSATATGRGLVAARPYFLPWALHSGTETVEPTSFGREAAPILNMAQRALPQASTGSRSIRSTHASSCAIPAADETVRGPRRKP